jgi:glycosyltransferase involved in cell wall biosynthesis
MGDEVSHDSLPNKWIWYRFYSRANVIVANSEFVKSSIRRAFRTEPRKVRLIYNVAPSCSKEPVDEVSSREGTRVERLKDGGLEKGCRVLYVGQIAEHKGVSQLLDASIALCREGWDCYFDFVGGSRYTQEYESSMLRRIANERLSYRICFHGRVEDPTSFYRRASVLVVPSLFEEPAANVVLEAKREGVPAIVFPSGGLPELLEDGVTGIVCREKSSHALLEVLRRGFSQPALFEGLGAACLGEYERRFSEARFDKQWEAVFSST